MFGVERNTLWQCGIEDVTEWDFRTTRNKDKHDNKVSYGEEGIQSQMMMIPQKMSYQRQAVESWSWRSETEADP